MISCDSILVFVVFLRIRDAPANHFGDHVGDRFGTSLGSIWETVFFVVFEYVYLLSELRKKGGRDEGKFGGAWPRRRRRVRRPTPQGSALSPA